MEPENYASTIMIRCRRAISVFFDGLTKVITRVDNTSVTILHSSHLGAGSKLANCKAAPLLFPKQREIGLNFFGKDMLQISLFCFPISELSRTIGSQLQSTEM
uniref:Uncharacterized protein n=1 Tax=Sphaerodactylus townsendi TaxID=933632 RepID=A0ACB8FIM6_9SAUR